MIRRGVQPPALAEFQAVFTGEGLLSEIAHRSAAARAVRRQQLVLPLGPAAGLRHASPTELRELLERLPTHADHLQHRRAKRALRTALERQWVSWDASTQHATADGRAVLAVLSLRPEGESEAGAPAPREDA